MNTISADGLSCIQRCENHKLVGYLDGAGVPTAGVGHTGPDVVVGQAYTQEQSDAWLAADSKWAADAVNRLCPVAAQNQFDAMVSLVFNIGVHAFVTSHVRTFHLALDYAHAADAFLLWDKKHDEQTGGLEPDDGLLKRRRIEADIYRGVPVADAIAAGEAWLTAKRAAPAESAPGAEIVQSDSPSDQPAAPPAADGAT